MVVWISPKTGEDNNINEDMLLRADVVLLNPVLLSLYCQENLAQDELDNECRGNVINLESELS